MPIKSYGLYKALFNEDYKSVDENNDGMIQKSEVKIFLKLILHILVDQELLITMN